MPSKISPADTHPALGAVIDNGTLELVEVLGVGGYGVVYRAVVIGSSPPQSFAVKCLMHGDPPNSRRRHIHLREIMLHRLAGAHPNVVTLHKVVEEGRYTFLILDFASAHDLFTQILHGRQYLGNDEIIRHVFLQLLDAVEYCHSLGIYHRDLKPENILCFDGGLRVAITDFGLATTDKMSVEYRTGSIYHMSPECHAGPSSYSPPANDIWSLGIILINLITGRNPFRSSAKDDPTFQCFVRNPTTFLPSVLPLSSEVNVLLSKMLAVDWRHRLPLSAVRAAIMEIPSFYSLGAMLEGSMARCPWEAPMEVDEQEVSSDTVSIHVEEVAEVSISEDSVVKSHWSQESASFLCSTKSSYRSKDNRQSWTPSCVDRSSSVAGSSYSQVRSSGSGSSDLPSWPITPDSKITSFAEAEAERTPRRQRLTIDTEIALQEKTCSDSSSIMSSALDALKVPFSFSPSKVQRMSGIEVHNPSWSEDAFNKDVEFISPTDWKMLDRSLSSIPGSPVSDTASCASVTTLSSFCAPCPSSILSFSSQDSFQYSPPFRPQTSPFHNSQPFRFTSHSPIALDISISCSQGHGSVPDPPPERSFPTQRHHHKWASESHASSPWPSSATTTKFAVPSSVFDSQSLHIHTGTVGETSSSLRLSPNENEKTSSKAQDASSSSPSSAGSVDTVASPHRRTPFRWFSGLKTNIFA